MTSNTHVRLRIQVANLDCSKIKIDQISIDTTVMQNE